MDGSRPSKGVNPLVKAGVLLHMLLILNWTLPDPPPAIANGSIPPTLGNIARNPSDFLLLGNTIVKTNSPLKYWLMFSGTWQYWDMFAPNPSNTDLWYDAIVTYKSGRQVVEPYPRMKDLGLLQKYFKERYRKYLERVNTDATDAWVRPDFAQRMALLAYDDPNDPPVKVEIRRHWKTMEAMDKPVPQEYSVYTLRPYMIDQDRLRKDAGR